MNSSSADRGLVLVTGAGSGIGEDAALYLNERGYSVAANVFSESDGEQLQSKATDAARMHVLPFDVTNTDEVVAARKRVDELLVGRNGLRALFSNAGIAAAGGDVSCEGAPIERQQKLMEVNHFGAVRVIQAFLPAVRAARGTVVVNTAMMAHVMLPFSGGYGASKCALDGWTDSLRREIAPLGVRVAKIHAGAIATGIGSHSDGTALDPDAARLYPGQIAMSKRLAQDLQAQADDPRCSPRRISELVLEAIEAEHPKRTYNVGGGHRILHVLGGLPEGVQDKIMSRMLRRMDS